MKDLLSKLGIGFHQEFRYKKPKRKHKLHKQEQRLENLEQTHFLWHKCKCENKMVNSSCTHTFVYSMGHLFVIYRTNLSRDEHSSCYMYVYFASICSLTIAKAKYLRCCAFVEKDHFPQSMTQKNLQR